MIDPVQTNILAIPHVLKVAHAKKIVHGQEKFCAAGGREYRPTRRLHHRIFRHEFRQPEICNLNRVVVW
jgi:hypothetical protein